MKKFLCRLTGFIFIPSILLLLIEIFICFQKNDILSEEMLFREFRSVIRDYGWITKVTPDKKILLLGSSSVRYGLSCTQLKKMSGDTISFINLAMNARDPVQTYFILKQIELTGVKSVYYGLDPWIFTKNYYKYRNSYLLLDMDIVTFTEYANENKINMFFVRYQGFLKYLFSYFDVNYKYYKKNNYIIPEDYGSEKLLERPTNFDNPVNDDFKIDKYGWSELQFIYLNKISNLCKDRNIDFVVFLPPKRSDFSKDYKKNCRIINDEFLNNLEKINFIAPVIGKFDQLDTLGDLYFFADPYHLNSSGQEMYTKIFFNMINDKITQKINKEYLWFGDNNNEIKTK